MSVVVPFRGEMTWPAIVTITVQGKSETQTYLLGTRDDQLTFRRRLYEAHAANYVAVELLHPMPAQCTVDYALARVAERLA